jgi:hypothetical protein
MDQLSQTGENLAPSLNPGAAGDWRVCWNCQKAFVLHQGDLDFQHRNVPDVDIDELLADENGKWTCPSCTVQKFYVGWAISDSLMKPGLIRYYFKKFLLRAFFGVETQRAAMHAGFTSDAESNKERKA